MESFSLFELNEYIRRVVALNFSEPIWVHGEISQIANSRGNYYLDLIQKDEDGDTILAKSAAVIWSKKIYFLKKKLGTLLPSLLQSDIEVKVKVRVDFHERYGLKLVIDDIDPSYTFGQLAVQREQIIKKLQDEELIDRNRQLELPSVVQRIAILSSSGAAGYKDFITQLQENTYGYEYHLYLFDGAVQGTNVQRDILGAFNKIEEKKMQYDCIVIIRGGGSKLDLSGFDDYEIGKAIANCDIPVITGIGHEIDQSIADIVSHTALKTPTAVADFLIDHNVRFEGRFLGFGEQLRHLSHTILNEHAYNLQHLTNQLENSCLLKIQSEVLSLNNFLNNIKNTTRQNLSVLNMSLKNLEQVIELSDPKSIQSKGFAIVLHNKRLVKTAKELKEGDKLQLSFTDGDVGAQVNKI